MDRKNSNQLHRKTGSGRTESGKTETGIGRTGTGRTGNGNGGTESGREQSANSQLHRARGTVYENLPDEYLDMEVTLDEEDAKTPRLRRAQSSGSVGDGRGASSRRGDSSGRSGGDLSGRSGGGRSQSRYDDDPRAEFARNGSRRTAGSRSGEPSANQSSTGQRSGSSGGGGRNRDASPASREATRRQNRKKARRKRILRGLQIALAVVLILIATAAIYLVSRGYAAEIIALRDEAVELVASSSEETFTSDRSTILYDALGGTMAELGGTKNVTYLTMEEIPDDVRKAFVSIEDKRFYQHPGFDIKGIARAVVAMVKNREVSGGGSTITQQLARNVFLSHERSWQRKVEEIFISIELERKYSKDQILTFYINNIYYMNGYYGIEAASEGYFSRPVQELNLAEIAFLCAIPNSPTYYDPLEHYDHTVYRQQLILSEMLEDGVIDEATYWGAVGTEVVLNPSQQTNSSSASNNYLTTYARNCAIRALMESEGFVFRYVFNTEEEHAAYDEAWQEAYDACESQLYSGGYRVYTSLNPWIQAGLQSSVDQVLADQTELKEDGVYALQSAAACIDNETGMVVAIVGGRSQDSLQGYTLNRGYASYRQPGSTIKPLIVYTPSFERGYTPDTIVRDEPIEGGPQNATDTYAGDVTVRYAVQQSLNTVAWKIFQEISPQTGLFYIQQMAFDGITEGDYNLSAALGGLSNGVTTVEMASGYAAIENDGVYRNPSCVESISMSNGREVYTNAHAGTTVYTQEAAREMTEVLETVITEGTGRGRGLGAQPSAGKTGTTNDTKDLWFCGYTPYYTTSVWVGYDTPRTMGSLSGSMAGRIWQDFMTSLHADLAVRGFPDSEYTQSAAAAAAEAARQAEEEAQRLAEEEAARQAEEEAKRLAEEEEARRQAEEAQDADGSPNGGAGSGTDGGSDGAGSGGSTGSGAGSGDGSGTGSEGGTGGGGAGDNSGDSGGGVTGNSDGSGDAGGGDGSSDGGDAGNAPPDNTGSGGE